MTKSVDFNTTALAVWRSSLWVGGMQEVLGPAGITVSIP